MIYLGRSHLEQITAAAEAAYPHECCGLLVGHRPTPGELRVTRVAASANTAAGDGTDRFEVDPQLRFDLMRQLEGSAEHIIGHYHSHPDDAARPSERDLEMAWEPELAWLIVSVVKGRAAHTSAYLPDREGGAFTRMKLIVGN